MGNDGGSIPKRRELVKEAARNPTLSELKATALESLSHAWTHDPLSSDQLDLESVVSDWRGRLYNYESILKALMPSDNEAGDSDHQTQTQTLNGSGESTELAFASTGIKSLRDIVKLKFKRFVQPGAAKEDREIWACPVSQKEIGPSTKSVYLVPCGHVFAEIAIKQIQEESCPECSEPFKRSNVIPILPTDKVDVQKLSARLDELKAQGLTHSLKKDKSAGKKNKRKAAAAEEDGKEDAGSKKSRKTNNGEGGQKPKPDISSRVSGINNPMTASLTAKVLAEQEEANKRRKLAAAR